MLLASTSPQRYACNQSILWKLISNYLISKIIICILMRHSIKAIGARNYTSTIYLIYWFMFLKGSNLLLFWTIYLFFLWINPLESPFCRQLISICLPEIMIHYEQNYHIFDDNNSRYSLSFRNLSFWHWSVQTFLDKVYVCICLCGKRTDIFWYFVSAIKCRGAFLLFSIDYAYNEWMNEWMHMDTFLTPFLFSFLWHFTHFLWESSSINRKEIEENDALLLWPLCLDHNRAILNILIVPGFPISREEKLISFLIQRR